MGGLKRGEAREFSFRFDSPEQREIRNQLDLIWVEAEKFGLVLGYNNLNDWAENFEQDAGGEHVVVLIPEEFRVFKRTVGSMNGELFGLERYPVPYLLNQGLISEFFGTKSQFEGIVRRPDDGTTEFVISQRYFKAENENQPYPSESEVSLFFEELGFIEVNPHQSNQTARFENHDLGLAMTDCHPKNFIKSSEGIHPFDVHFELLNDRAVSVITEILV